MARVTRSTIYLVFGFRKMVATDLDKHGYTPRQIADRLGHARPSVTLVH